MKKAGFSGNDVVSRDFMDDAAPQASIIASTASKPAALAIPSNASRTVYFVFNSGDEYQLNVASTTVKGSFGTFGYRTKVCTIFDLGASS